MSNRKRLLLLCSTLVIASPFAALTLSAAASDYDELPVAVKSVAPVYPVEMQREQASGIVMVKVQIDHNGDVVESVVTKSTRAEFDAAAMAAVKRWKFKPAKKGGIAVESTVTIPIKFAAET